MEDCPLGKFYVQEIWKYAHSIPGMKFSTTSANSLNTNKLYNYIYSLYSIAALFLEAQKRIDATIIPKKIQESRKKALQEELNFQEFAENNKGKNRLWEVKKKENQADFGWKILNSTISKINFKNIATINLNKQENEPNLIDSEKYLWTLHSKSTRNLLKEAKSGFFEKDNCKKFIKIKK